MFYTGIGSRETPREVMVVMYHFAIQMAERGLILRSGGANGADTAFEYGARKAQGKMEIYLPWYNFNVRDSQFTQPTDAAQTLASEIHPAWDRCSRGARALHARSCHQVLGMDLATPSAFLVCWTPGGKNVGGTRTAITLAKMSDIRVFNLFNHDIGLLQMWLKK